jgi:photosystem II stability/assembly factor-like uncharacterized protein
MAAVGAALVVAALVSLAASATAPAADWSWTDYSRTLNDVSCAAPGACVAVGQEGMVLHTTPDAANPLAWSTIPGVTAPGQLVAVTCTTGFCLAVSDDNGPTIATTRSRVYQSTDGGTTWSAGVALPAARVDGISTFSGADVACDPAGACYVVGIGGGIWRSTDAGASWTALPSLPDTGSFRQVGCPDAGRCVAVGGTSKLGSTAVVDGTTTTTVPIPATFQGTSAVGCDQPTRCVVVDAVDHFAFIALPGSRFGAVKQIPHATPEPKSVAIRQLSCPAANTCVGQGGGYVMRTTSLSSDGGGWRKRPLGDGLTAPLKSLACAQAACVSVGAHAFWFGSSDTAFTWSPANQLGKLSALQCFADPTGVCVGGGSDSVATTRSGGRLWTSPVSGATGLDIAAVQCSDPTTCLLLGTGQTLYTTDLNEFTGRFPPTFGPAPASGLACVNTQVCIAAGGGLTTMTTDAGQSLWSKTAFPGGMTGSAFCFPGQTDPITCVVLTVGGGLLRGTATLTAGKPKWTWTTADIDSPAALKAVSCSSAAHCTVVGADATVFTSDDSSLLFWTDHSIQRDVVPANRADLTAVDCPADGVCVAGGAHGAKTYIASTDDAWGHYQLSDTGPIGAAEPTVSAIDCDTLSHCIVVGDDAIVGTR